MSSSASPAAKLAGLWNAQVICRSLAKASATSTRAARGAGAGTVTSAGLRAVGSEPNHLLTVALMVAGSKSPTIVKVALAGTYQVRQKFLTSSSDAPARSSWRPIVR